MPPPQLSTINAIDVPASPSLHPAFIVPHSSSISSLLLACCLSSPCSPHLKLLPTSTHRLVRWRMPQERTTSTSAMHVKPNIASLALAQVCALLDSGLSGFGYIHSVFVCLFIPLLVLDSLFVSLAPTQRLLPSDTDPCHSLSTLRPLLHIEIPYIFASPLITGLPLSHTTPRGLSPAALDFNSFSFFFPTHSFSA